MLLESAGLRKQLTQEAAFDAFCRVFSSKRLTVDESYNTHYDSLEGHWSWWLRIEGHFVKIPPERKAACDAAIRAAIGTLGEADRIPYTVHLLHVKVCRP